MLVKLPRTATGQEIVNAFRRASSFVVDPNQRLEGKEFVGKYQYEPGSVKQTIRSLGVKVNKFFWKRKHWFWGPKIWKRHNSEFTLEPLVLENTYRSVEVDVEYAYYFGQAGDVHVAKGPSNPHFEDIRPIFEKILANFFSQLRSQVT